MDWLPTITAGFETIDADKALKAKAAQNLVTWLTHADYAAYRPQLEKLIADKKWSVLLDSFYQVMPFGTGGRRGAVGLGFPQVRVVAVFSLACGAIVGAALGLSRGKQSGENALRRALAGGVEGGSVVVADRYFGGWFDLALWQQRRGATS